MHLKAQDRTRDGANEHEPCVQTHVQTQEQRQTHTETDALVYLIAILSFTSTLWLSHSLPPVRPNSTEESTCLSRAYCISLRCLSPYLSLPPSALLSLHPHCH